MTSPLPPPPLLLLPSLSSFPPSPDPISSQRKKTERGREAECSCWLGRPPFDRVPPQERTLPSVSCWRCYQECRSHRQELPAPCRHSLYRRARYILGWGGWGPRTVALSPQHPPPSQGKAGLCLGPFPGGALPRVHASQTHHRGGERLEEQAWSLFVETPDFGHIWWQWDLAWRSILVWASGTCVPTPPRLHLPGDIRGVPASPSLWRPLSWARGQLVLSVYVLWSETVSLPFISSARTASASPARRILALCGKGFPRKNMRGFQGGQPFPYFTFPGLLTHGKCRAPQHQVQWRSFSHGIGGLHWILTAGLWSITESL